MEQRPLRLGDIVDDYCPRERRVTNHAIVAIVGDSVRQTRCSTCDAEHEFKGARMPRKKVKSPADAAAGVLVTPQAASASAEAAAVVEVAVAAAAVIVEVEPALAVADAESPTSAPEEPVVEGWSTHRRLIRATLPRVEGAEPPPRPIPEFTMHQRQSRGFQGRGFRHGGHGNGGHHGNFANGNHGNQGNGNSFRDGNGPDGNRAQPQGQGKPGGGGRRRRRRRR